MGVVREDVVRMGFDIDFAELTRLTSALDDIRTLLTSGIGDDAFDEMIQEGRQATRSVDGIRDSINGIRPDGLEDTVEGLRDTDREGEDAYAELRRIARTNFDRTVSGLKSIVTTLGKVGVQAGKLLAKGIAVGVAGVGALVAKSITNYADYEQLVGGVETLFGDSAGAVQMYADNAFKTAGLSANEYMETVTSFSASLIQSLGGNTGAAAEYANMAITDMSDNANKMGTDMSSIQDAYQGFAKQNYTMLDNLKLGYGGTQEEMKRLLKDASAISGIEYDISSYADVVAAIHTIQESMGIAGTTSKEASETISGSFASMKAAWSNTLTSLILGGDDFDRCVDNLVDSAKTFGKNIMPALMKALEGVGMLIEELAPIVEAELPKLIDTLLPPLIKAATALIKGIIVALPDIIKTLVDELPGVLQQVWEGIREAFGDVPGIDKAEEFFGKLITFLKDNADTIKKVVPAIIGLVVAFKLFNKIKGLTGLFGGSGGSGGSGGGFFSSLASMKPTTVLKGIGNLAIIIGGLGILAAALMYVSPYMAQLSDWKSIVEVLLVITAVGLIGTALSKLAGLVGNVPVSSVAKGVANIAIALVGMGALTAVLMWLAPYISQLSDMKTTFDILIMISAVGIVGSALAALAGLIGLIPIEAVLLGIANIAVAIVGFTAIVAAYGALALIPGFNDFLKSGGEVLATLCNILGNMVGSIIGGIGEGITNSLPKIGENLSAFATSLQPMFDIFAGVDAAGLSDFAGALAMFIAVIAGEKIVSVITGGIDYADLGNKLSAMATNLSGFFSTIMTFPEGGFEKATALFDCLAGISSLPKEGGVVGWFQGEVDFATMATGLNLLAGTVSFFTAIQAIPEEAFTKAGQLFDCLAGIKALPKEGGVVGWFTGEVNFANIASGIQSLASEGMISALTTLSALPETAFTSLSTMFNALAGIKAMPKEGGIAGWFSGDSTTALNNVASQLPGVASNIASFFTNLGGRTDFTPIKTLFDTLGNIKINSDAANKGFLSLGQSKLEEMGTGLSNFATNASTFFTKINSLNADNITSFFSAISTAGDLPDTLSTLDSTVGTALSNLVTTTDTKLKELKSKFSTNLTEIIALISAASTGMYTSGASMMDGLNNGIESKRATLIATVQSIAQAVQDAFDVELDINSPSKVMIDKGEDTVMGQVIGMRNRLPDVNDASTDVAEAAVPKYTRTYSPDTDSSTIYNNRSSSEYTTISPSFNLNISGTQDDRATARKVKKWINEAIQETFESFDRATPEPREA
jgi:hypothetical protein